MKKMIITLFAAGTMLAMPAMAQENTVNRIPETGQGRQLNTPQNDQDTGFWIAPELSGGYTCRTHNSNMPWAELDVTAGYRFSEYLKVGAGIGGRWYMNQKPELRYNRSKWSFPIYVDIRGNLISDYYRQVVPYYSFDIGGAIQDGFMIRPTVGIRIGEHRRAFLVGISYVGQDMRRFEYVERGGEYFVKKKNHFVSSIALRVGYEF